jgi:hypothetical protein
VKVRRKTADPSSEGDTLTSMVQTSAPPQTALRRGRRWGLAVPVLAVVSLMVISALACADTARATSRDALRSLRFGRPMNWLIQNQTSMDPPSYPRDQPFSSPWENPVTIDVPPLLLNFTLALVILVGLWLAIRVLVSRR